MPSAAASRRLLRDPSLHIVFSVTLMAMLGVSSITPAFPAIATALDVTPQAVGLLIAVFTLPGVLLTPVLGVAADRYGRKKVLVPSLVLFGIAGGSCAFARSFELLVALRLLQGAGAAALGAINVTLIGDLYEGAKRTTAMGYNAAVLSVGTAVYPAIGGALATLAWYAPFLMAYLAVPVGLVVLFALPTPVGGTREPLRRYLRTAGRLMWRREVLALFAAGLSVFILLYGAYLSYLPFVLQTRFDATPLAIGGVFAAASATTAVASFNLGRWAGAIGERNLVRLGFAGYAVTLALMPVAPTMWMLIPLVAGFGAAGGIAIPSILTLISSAAPGAYRAAFMSVNGTLLRLGQTLGPLVAAAAFTAGGFRLTFWLASGIGAGMLVVLMVGLEGKDVGKREAGNGRR